MTKKARNIVAGDNKAALWNISWLKPKLQNAISLDSVVDKQRMKELTPVITFRETRAYNGM